MTTQKTNIGQRAVIAIIGKRNAGKSTLLNQLIGEEISIVSDTPGTTTDSVFKAYELLPYGPVVFYDTAGLDDTQDELGQKRVKASEKIIQRADLILYVIGKDGASKDIKDELERMQNNNIKFIPVFNFADCTPQNQTDKDICSLYHGVRVSAKTKDGIDLLKKRIIDTLQSISTPPALLQNLITPKDVVLLVTPIDTAAPKGRMILPQVQVTREILDNDAIVITAKVNEISNVLQSLKKQPDLVITDSQAVKEVNTLIPQKIPLTTFSMLFARSKGNFFQMAKGIDAVKTLKNNAKILIAEGCSHHVTCDDIGRVKIPTMLKKYSQKELNFEFTSGYDFPENIKDYDLIIHCGGCMLNHMEIKRRLRVCEQQNIPVTNYGMIISLMQGVFERTSAPLI